MTVPPLTDLLTELGKVGRRLDQLHACEAGAGNMSIALHDTPDLTRFPLAEDYALPQSVPALAGWTVVVTGAGTRLRDVAEQPTACLAVLIIGDDGAHAVLRSAPERTYMRATSEFNSHLCVHADQVSRRPGLAMHTLIHAQPRYLVALSHIPSLVDTVALSRAITRWEPETLIQLPDGIGVMPFAVPGSDELMDGNVRLLRDHQIVVWCKHGIMVRSDAGPLSAVDKVEYAEAGAMYEYWNRTGGNQGEGLTHAQLRGVIDAFAVPTDLY
jgi:rhamnulose-1-phosphate aldolase